MARKPVSPGRRRLAFKPRCFMTQSSAAAKSTESVPQVDGYDIIAKLAQGATASVWKARQISLGRLVVIKSLYEHLARDADDVQLFKREALVAANLKHPGIVQVYDFGRYKQGAGYYIVMEYISGYTVGDWLRRKGRLEEKDALIIAHSVSEALRYAWEQARVVHCDIKPENIMVDGDGTVKITDLGLAQAFSTVKETACAADEICVMGTPNYMSPEQARGENNLDCRTDIYALGATLHHILSGALPFGNAEPADIVARQQTSLLEDPRALNPSISADLARLIMKMLAKDPAARYQNWTETLREIIRLEKIAFGSKTLSQTDRSAVTIPLQVISDQQAGSSAPAQPQLDLTPCPYCAEPINKRAVYCRYCGKALPGASSDPLHRTKAKLTLKSQPASQPAAARLPERLPSLQIKRPFSFWNLLKSLFSLALLGLLGVYGYYKLVRNEDIFSPIRSRFYEIVIPWLEQAPWNNPYWREDYQAWLERRQLVPLSDNELGEPESASQPPPAPTLIEEPAVAPQPSAPPPAPMRPAQPAPAAAPPPAPIQTPAPAQQSAQESLQENELYQSLLRQSEQLRPQPGQPISLQLQGRSEPLTGTLISYQAEALLLKVLSGEVSVPYNIMDEATRRLCLPNERALYLYRRQQPQP